MSKIITAINVMVSNPELITNVVKGESENECFFLYDNKHTWSILQRTDKEFYLAYYPGKQDISELASIPDEAWHHMDINCVAYNSKDLGTKEAKASMAELFSIVNEKAFGMDEVLDDIINSNPPF